MTHIGTVHCSSSLTLTNVFHIPSFKFNLLSISQLTKSINCDVIFSSSECIFQDRAIKNKIGRGSARNGLYYLDADLDFNSAFSFKHCNKFDLWHSRLGRPSRSRFDFIVKNSPNGIANKDFFVMYVRVLNNHVFFFPQSSSCSSHCFELIHIDIWGSFSIYSKNISRFFLTIVDDYSKCTWIYLMK